MQSCPHTWAQPLPSITGIPFKDTRGLIKWNKIKWYTDSIKIPKLV